MTAHEYVKVDGNVGTCGITDFAQAALGDIVFIDLPEVGDEFDKGDSFGSVESVKAASDVYAPVSGTVVEINEQLTEEPGMVNEHAEGDAWFIKIKIKDDSELGDLLGPDAYKVSRLLKLSNCVSFALSNFLMLSNCATFAGTLRE